MAGLTRTLPTSVFVRTDAITANREVKETLARATHSLSVLMDLQEDLGAIPTKLEDITTTWLDSVINAKIEAIQSMPLPTNTKDAMKSEWLQIKGKATQAIADISVTLSVQPQLQCRIEGNQIVCDNKEEWITTKATYTIPSKYREHYRLVGNLIEAANKLRYYERKNKLKEASADFYIGRIRSVNDYTDMVAEGRIEQEPTTEQVKRLFFYQQYKM